MCSATQNQMNSGNLCGLNESTESIISKNTSTKLENIDAEYTVWSNI